MNARIGVIFTAFIITGRITRRIQNISPFSFIHRTLFSLNSWIDFTPPWSATDPFRARDAPPPFPGVRIVGLFPLISKQTLGSPHFLHPCDTFSLFPKIYTYTHRYPCLVSGLFLLTSKPKGLATARRPRQCSVCGRTQPIIPWIA